MDRPPGLMQVTTYSLRELSGFFRHLASACELFEDTGSLPPSLFPTSVAQPLSPTAREPASSREPALGHPAQQSQEAPSPLAQPSAFAPPPTNTPRTHKRRKAEKRTRPPTGYNLFMRDKLESLKREGMYNQYPDSKAVFKAAVEDWRGLPEDQRRVFTQQALDLQNVAQAGPGTSELQETAEVASEGGSPTASLDQGPEQSAQDPGPVQPPGPIRPEPVRHPAMQRPPPPMHRGLQR